MYDCHLSEILEVHGAMNRANNVILIYDKMKYWLFVKTWIGRAMRKQWGQLNWTTFFKAFSRNTFIVKILWFSSYIVVQKHDTWITFTYHPCVSPNETFTQATIILYNLPLPIPKVLEIFFCKGKTMTWMAVNTKKLKEWNKFFCRHTNIYM